MTIISPLYLSCGNVTVAGDCLHLTLSIILQCETELSTHKRSYDAKLDVLQRMQKAEMEKAETTQATEMKNHNKKMKTDQV